jgi:hypothetical protein
VALQWKPMRGRKPKGQPSRQRSYVNEGRSHVLHHVMFAGHAFGKAHHHACARWKVTFKPRVATEVCSLTWTQTPLTSQHTNHAEPCLLDCLPAHMCGLPLQAGEAKETQHAGLPLRTDEADMFAADTCTVRQEGILQIVLSRVLVAILLTS